MEPTLTFISNARQIVEEIGPFSICFMLPFGIFVMWFSSALFLAMGNSLYKLLESFMPGYVPKQPKDTTGYSERLKYTITAFISFLAAVGTIALAVNGILAVEQSKRANDLKEQELRILIEKH